MSLFEEIVGKVSEQILLTPICNLEKLERKINRLRKNEIFLYFMEIEKNFDKVAVLNVDEKKVEIKSVKEIVGELIVKKAKVSEMKFHFISIIKNIISGIVLTKIGDLSNNLNIDDLYKKHLENSVQDSDYIDLNKQRLEKLGSF